MSSRASLSRWPRSTVAAMFYGLFISGAVSWNLIAGRPLLELWWRHDSTVDLALLGAGLGLVLAALTVALSRLTVARFRWAEELYRWFAALLGSLRWWDALWLASLSAVGEELLFRGAMQPSFGLYWTSLLFAMMHLPPRVALLSWTIGAGAVGLGLGAITRYTHNTVGAVISHFAINLLNLKHAGDFATEKLPADPSPPRVAKDGISYAPEPNNSADSLPSDPVEPAGDRPGES